MSTEQNNRIIKNNSLGCVWRPQPSSKQQVSLRPLVPSGIIVVICLCLLRLKSNTTAIMICSCCPRISIWTLTCTQIFSFVWSVTLFTVWWSASRKRCRFLIHSYVLTCIILFVHWWAQSLQVKFSDILSLGWIDDCKLLKIPAYIFNFYLFIASANSFFPGQSVIPETGGGSDWSFEEEIWWTAGIWCLWYLMVCAWVHSGLVVI